MQVQRLWTHRYVSRLIFLCALFTRCAVACTVELSGCDHDYATATARTMFEDDGEAEYSHIFNVVGAGAKDTLVAEANVLRGGAEEYVPAVEANMLHGDFHGTEEYVPDG